MADAVCTQNPGDTGLLAPGSGCFQKTDNFKIKNSCQTDCGGNHSISGRKFYDQGSNNPPVAPNGVLDGGDSPLSGWTIVISGTLGGSLFTASVVTQGDGTWAAQAVDDGTSVTVCEVMQTSWT